MSRPAGRPAFATSDAGDLFREAVALGWTWKKKGSGHIIMRPPKGEGYMPMSTTHVGSRAVLNNRSNLNRWKKEQGL